MLPPLSGGWAAALACGWAQSHTALAPWHPSACGIAPGLHNMDNAPVKVN
jgi:hypothetical protein